MTERESLVELFLKLAAIQAPSGFEEPMMKAFRQEILAYVDEVKDTPRGNMIAVQKGTDPAAPKIALVAHLDQIGFIVTNIDQTGFVRFRKLGGSVTRAIQGQHFLIHTEKGAVPGVAGLKPGHITTAAEANTIPPLEELYIDIGATSQQDTESMGVKIGSPITYGASSIRLANGLVASPSVDDRAGISALIELAKRFSKSRPKATIYYVGSVEEEIGLRGAETALYNLEIDLAIAVDTFSAGFQPEVSMRDLFYEIGKGPGLHVGEIGDRIRIESRQVHRWLRSVAEKNGIPHQVGLMYGSTDVVALMQTRSGIPSATIGIPRRYSHSPIEVFNPADLENLIKILTIGLQSLDSGFNLHRI